MAGVGEALAAGAAGKRLEREQVLALLGAELPELMLAAAAACRRVHPRPARSYVVDRNINHTNVCLAQCRFCAFWRPPGHPEAYLLGEEAILAKVEEAVAAGATQILMQGGLHPEIGLEWLCRTLRAIKSRFPVHLHSLSPPEVVHAARRDGVSLPEAMARLHEAGLDSLPGGGAEVLADLIRGRVSPGKCTVEEWFEVMAAAADLGMRTTATMMFGHGEGAGERVEHLLRVREAQDRLGCFEAFIPWTYQPGNTALGGRSTGGDAYLRMVAVARLALDNVAHVQASWVTQGLKVAAVALHGGADDMGGTMMEENVVRAAGAKPDATRDEVVEAIRAAGFAPWQRDTYYRPLAPGMPLAPAPGRQ